METIRTIFVVAFMLAGVIAVTYLIDKIGEHFERRRKNGRDSKEGSG